MSRNWLNLTYAMQAESSPSKCTDGLSMVVLIDLKFLLSTVREGRREKESGLVDCKSEVWRTKEE